MLDRTQQPQFTQDIKFRLAPAECHTLKNGAKIFALKNASLEVFRLEVLFRAGSYFGNSIGESFFTSKMLLGGTKKQSASELINAFDTYGGFVEVSQSFENLTFVIHGLSKYFDKYLETLMEVLQESTIPDQELEIQKNISLQNYLINKEKTAFECTNEFRKLLYGDNHRFGKVINTAEIETINQFSISEFYKSYIQNQIPTLFLAGNFSDINLEVVKNNFAAFFKTNDVKIETALLFDKNTIKIVKEDAVQSTIKMGKRMFSRNHADYFKFLITNTYLGGYFGSKLMKNIREEKGLTYGISSSLVTVPTGSYFAISTDVKKENKALAIEEIYKEIEEVKTVLISDDELQTIKNYVAGSLLGSAVSVFDILDKHKSMHIENLSKDYYDNFINTVNDVKPTDIIEMANKYLNDLSVVSVG